MKKAWEMKNKMSKRFCPKCKSEDVQININASASFGAPQMWKCNKCGFQNYIFPEKEKIGGKK